MLIITDCVSAASLQAATRVPLTNSKPVACEQVDGDFNHWLASVRPYTDKIYHHRFNQLLYQGSLPKVAFDHFLQQDRRYLLAYGEHLQQLIARLQDEPRYYWLTHYLDSQVTAILAMEQHMQSHYRFSSASLPLGPAILAYLAHLDKASHKATVVRLAALLPCFYLYAELGKRMPVIHLSSNHPYRSWLETYANPSFLATGNAMLSVLRTLLAQSSPRLRCEAHRYFTRSVAYELAFFDEITTHI